MAWAAVFPTGAQLISQSVGQFQANWAFIETTFGTDHIFNNLVTPAQNGHHKFSQYLNQGADPAVALDSVIYSKNAGIGLTSTPQPFFRNSTNVRQMSTFMSGTTVIVPPGTDIFTGAGMQPFMGWLHVVNLAPSTTYATAFVYWNGAGTINVSQVIATGGITITSNVAAVKVNSAGGIGVSWACYTIPL